MAAGELPWMFSVSVPLFSPCWQGWPGWGDLQAGGDFPGELHGLPGPHQRGAGCHCQSGYGAAGTYSWGALPSAECSHLLCCSQRDLGVWKMPHWPLGKNLCKILEELRGMMYAKCKTWNNYRTVMPPPVLLQKGLTVHNLERIVLFGFSSFSLSYLGIQSLEKQDTFSPKCLTEIILKDWNLTSWVLF